MEIWKQIQGSEGCEVSNLGRVRSYWEVGKHKMADTPILKALRIGRGNGYLMTTLRLAPGNYKTFYVHRLVLNAFKPEPTEKVECRHLDGNKTNNRLENLCWGTRSENIADRLGHGSSNRGSRHGLSKLNEKQVIEIKRLIASGERTGVIARMFKISPPTISGIRNGTRWIHIQI